MNGAYYLGEAISLGRAAELLDLPWAELRLRFLRLGIPILAGPENIGELHDEIEAVKQWETQNRRK